MHHRQAALCLQLLVVLRAAVDDHSDDLAVRVELLQRLDGYPAASRQGGVVIRAEDVSEDRQSARSLQDLADLLRVRAGSLVGLRRGRCLVDLRGADGRLDGEGRLLPVRWLWSERAACRVAASGSQVLLDGNAGPMAPVLGGALRIEVLVLGEDVRVQLDCPCPPGRSLLGMVRLDRRRHVSHVARGDRVVAVLVGLLGVELVVGVVGSGEARHDLDAGGDVRSRLRRAVGGDEEDLPIGAVLVDARLVELVGGARVILHPVVGDEPTVVVWLRSWPVVLG